MIRNECTSGVVRIYEQGDPVELIYEVESVGEPATGQVLLQQEAIGLNYVDTHFRSGVFPLAKFPATIGVEAAGVIVAAGDGVGEFRVGDRV